jgi:hypothetical protein
MNQYIDYLWVESQWQSAELFLLKIEMAANLSASSHSTSAKNG